LVRRTCNAQAQRSGNSPRNVHDVGENTSAEKRKTQGELGGVIALIQEAARDGEGLKVAEKAERQNKRRWEVGMVSDWARAGCARRQLTRKHKKKKDLSKGGSY